MTNDLTPLEARQSKYLGIAIDYLLGKKYAVIRRIYRCNNGYIQYALSKAGVATNRIRSRPRFKGYKERGISKELIAMIKANTKVNDRYFEKGRYIHCSFYGKDNNPVLLVDDLDYMERLNGTDGVDDITDDSSLRYHIEISEEGKFKYVKGGEN